MRRTKRTRFRKRLYAFLWLFCLCLFAGASGWPSASKPQATYGSTPQTKSLALSNDSNLLEVGNYAPSPKVVTAHAEIKIVSYNIRWRGGEDLNRLIAFLRNDAEIGAAGIIGLQEVDQKRKRTANENTARRIAQELALNYVWAAPPPPTHKDEGKAPEEETGVGIFSPYPISDVERIVLPNPGPGGRWRAAVGATVHVGNQNLRVYSVHAETRISINKKMEQLQSVLDAAVRSAGEGRVVVMGDFNTIKRKDVRACVELFTERGFTTPVPNNRSTWKTFIIKLKLDWLWLRGLEGTGHNIVRRIGLSDHWPLWVTAKL